MWSSHSGELGFGTQDGEDAGCEGGQAYWEEALHWVGAALEALGLGFCLTSLHTYKQKITSKRAFHSCHDSEINGKHSHSFLHGIGRTVNSEHFSGLLLLLWSSC